MDNDHTLLSFVELTNAPVEEARRVLFAADNILEVAIQNYYDAQANDSAEPPPLEGQPDYDEDNVRAPLPREYSQLVEEESVRSAQLNRVKRQFASSFRDLEKETEIQEDLARGIAPKKKFLEDIYRNPIDITCNLDLYSAKIFGQKQGKWIALLINDENFQSLCFNRDIFNSDPKQKAKTLIKKNFILLRKSSSCEESVRILQNYKLNEQSIPVFLIIDSLTGELKKNFGETKDLTLKSVVQELKKYTSTADKELKYSPEGIEDSDDDSYYTPVFGGHSSRTTSQVAPTTSRFAQKILEHDSDSGESFASLHSDDVENSDNEEQTQEQSDHEMK